MSYWEKVVADYCNISLFDVENMDYIAFLTLRRDAFIYSYNQTEAGREYLDNAYRLEQTAPQRDKLRDQFGATDGK